MARFASLSASALLAAIRLAPRLCSRSPIRASRKAAAIAGTSRPVTVSAAAPIWSNARIAATPASPIASR